MCSRLLSPAMPDDSRGDGSVGPDGGDRARQSGGDAERTRHQDNPDVAALRKEVTALADTLERIETELSPGRGRRVGAPRLRDIRRFTADVTIPLVILVLETNVRALRILQRALRPAAESGGVETGAGRRAADVSRRTLDRLDGVLSDLQNSLTDDDSLTDVLDEATALQRRVADELERMEDAGGRPGADWSGADDTETVSIDVEAELESIKDQLEDEDDGDDRA